MRQLAALCDGLNSGLQEKLGDRIWLFDSIDSTNNYLFDKKPPSLCVAWQQSAGRGRNGKHWQSQPQSIAFSFGWQFKNYQKLDGLSLTIGVALYDFLQKLGIAEPQLKWPNDLLLGGKKVCGILVDIIDYQSTPLAITGIGINILKAPDGATCLAAHTQHQLPDKPVLCALLANQIYETLKTFDNEGFTAMRKRWLSRDNWYGKEVMVMSNHKQIYGVHAGIDDKGNLLVQTARGIEQFSSGDVSLRKP